MRGTMPILTCDNEDGCTEWIVDNYEAGATNWRDFLGGWRYDPHCDRDRAFCPEHAPCPACSHPDCTCDGAPITQAEVTTPAQVWDTADRPRERP